MHLTKFTDLSVRVLMDLALHAEQCKVKDIAARHNMSVNHLMKVVTRLSTRGYIKTLRGRNGGIWLAKSPEDMNLGTVVREMELTLNVVDCERMNCPIEPACRLKKVFRDASENFLNTLDAYTIADLVANREQLMPLIDGKK